MSSAASLPKSHNARWFAQGGERFWVFVYVVLTFEHAVFGHAGLLGLASLRRHCCQKACCAYSG
eukprot:3118011-Amphidinium_carterae.1